MASIRIDVFRIKIGMSFYLLQYLIREYPTHSFAGGPQFLGRDLDVNGNLNSKLEKLLFAKVPISKHGVESTHFDMNSVHYLHFFLSDLHIFNEAYVALLKLSSHFDIFYNS